jgi:hypothetical protein
MKSRQVTRITLFLAALALCLSGAWLSSFRPVAGQTADQSTLQGAAALDRLKQDGQFDALQTALDQARFSVSRSENTPLGRAAWHAPNRLAGYDAYVTEEGVSVVVNDQTIVGLSLHSLGYGHAMQGVTSGKVSGDRQTINVAREGGVREWFVNGPDGLEHGFTLNEPPGARRQGVPLRLALQVSKGWRAVAGEDGKAVTLRGAGVAVEYSKLVVNDNTGRVIPARLTVDEEQVVIEVEDHDAAYPLTIDPTFSLQQKLLAADGAANERFGDAVALSGDTVVVGLPYDNIGWNQSQGSVYVFTRSGGAWTQSQVLTAYDGEPGDFFGSAVTVSGDTLAVGAYADDISPNANQGSVYVFTRSGATWTIQQKLFANDGAAEDYFGRSVALSGDTVVAGAYGDDIGQNTFQGSAYVFTRSGSAWTQQQKLTANDGAKDDAFGAAVALDGDTVVVGSQGGDGAVADQGAAYVFTRSGSVWTSQQKLTANDGAQYDSFGISVAISGDTVAVGASNDKIGLNVNQGSAYVFKRSGSKWKQQQKLTAFDGASGDLFGHAVALYGDIVVAGATKDNVGANSTQGSTYVFARSGSTWTHQQKLTAFDGAADDRFGAALAVSDDTVAVGVGRDDVKPNIDQGSVYVFALNDASSKIGGAARESSALPSLAGEEAVARLKEEGLYSSLAEAVRAARSESSSAVAQTISLPFAQLFRQTASDGAANDSYGYSVAATDDTVVIGAYLDGFGGGVRQGSVYVFSRSSDDWTWQQKLTAFDGASEDRFGHSVAINGDTLVVGAPYDTTGTTYYHGSAYVFTRSNGVWSFQQKLTANDGAAYDQFGYSVAISGDTVVAGAFSDDIGTKADQGSAYVYVRSSGVWSFQQKLTDNDGQAMDQFGVSVAISGNTIIAGAPLDDLAEKDAGSACVFVRSGTAWAQTQKLSGVNSAGSYPGDLFGLAVAISGDTAIIGAPFFDTFGRVNQGLAVAYVRSSGFWVYKGYLTANDGEADDRFGSSVVINGDTALVGAHFDDIGTPAGVNLDQGSAYLFTWSGTTWAPRQKFTAKGGAAREYFGQAVALSGDRAIVGAPHAKIGANLSQGAVYVFGCGYVEQPKLPNIGAVAEDGFGFAVAVDGDTAVVGAPLDDVGSRSNRGSAYVFTRNGVGWTRSAQIFAPDGQANDKFGYSVAISGDTIVIGAPKVTRNGVLNRGSVYIFTGSGRSWALQKQVLGGGTDDHFGWSVAIGGNLVAIGSPYADLGIQKDRGRVDLYNRSGVNWTHQQILIANDGAASDHFGFSVALSGERLVVGAPSRDGSKGAAYVFEPATQSDPWGQRAKLSASDAQTGDKFGHSVALSDNTALASAPGKVNNALSRQAAYVFVTPSASGGAWSQQARLLLGAGDSTYPLSVALSGNTAVIGTSGEKIAGSYPEGTAYVFTRSGAVWTPQQQVVASDGQEADAFGVSVAIDGAAIMVGASQAGSVKQGAVYVLKNNCGSSLARIANVTAPVGIR